MCAKAKENIVSEYITHTCVLLDPWKNEFNTVIQQDSDKI